MPPKRWCCASPTPPAHCTSPLCPPPWQKPVFGWLLLNKSSISGHLRPHFFLTFLFFAAPFHTPNDATMSPHALPSQPASVLASPLPLRRLLGWLLCFITKHRPPKARARRISLFFVCPIPGLQWMELATARAHRMQSACYRPIGSGGAMSSGRHCSTHGEREGKTAGG